jgi:hypothetical protein
MVDGVDSLWVFAYYQHGLSELAVRNPGVDCRVFLWLDVAEEWVYLRVGNRSCAGGCYLAFSVPGFVTGGYGHDVAGYYNWRLSANEIGSPVRPEKNGNRMVTSVYPERLSQYQKCAQ